jgi:predicted TIM-barrel fold metal-dependent hydrolase
MTTQSATQEATRMTGGLDVHAHWFPRRFLAEVAEVRSKFGGSPTLDRLGNDERIATTPDYQELSADRLALMDGAGIATQVLSYSSPHPYHPDEEARARLARVWNDETSLAAAGSAGRFRFFATLPLPFTAAALREVDRARELPGFAGYGVPTHIDGAAIDGDFLAPVFDRINALGAIAFFHPDGFCVPGALTDYAMEWTLGAPFEDTIAALRLIGSKTVANCPDIRFVLPHLGGTLPFLMSRVERHWARQSIDGGLSPAAAMRRLYFDTAQTTPAMLSMAAEVFGAAQLVFGTDFPYVNLTDFLAPARDLLTLGPGAALAAFRGIHLGL